jgi:hypothetical protein
VKNDTLSKLDLLGNVIGDAGGSAVLALYEQRKLQKLPAINVRVSHRMSKALFDSIAKVTKWGSGESGGGATKGKKKGGKKKVWCGSFMLQHAMAWELIFVSRERRRSKAGDFVFL